MNNYPTFQDFDLSTYLRIDSLQILGFVAHHRPDIHIITDKTEQDFHPDSIILEIITGLRKGKKVCLFFWDEDFIMPNEHSTSLNKELSRFANEPVYLCTNLDQECLLVYTEQRQIPIKIISIPWWLTQLSYYYKKKHQLFFGPDNTRQNLQFACYINRPDWHKKVLVDNLLEKGFGAIGDIRLQNQTNQQNHQVYYQKDDELGWTSSHDMKRSKVWDEIDNTWICHGTRNFLRLEKMLTDIPLVINPESNLGIFPVTEKSIWPIMMDRMVMIFGRPRIMKSLQQYVDYDWSIYLDLEFDEIDGWTEKDQLRRLNCMLEKNRYTITHAREIWHNINVDLKRARQRLPEKIYDAFCQGLDLIV